MANEFIDRRTGLSRKIMRTQHDTKCVRFCRMPDGTLRLQFAGDGGPTNDDGTYQTFPNVAAARAHVKRNGWTLT